MPEDILSLGPYFAGVEDITTTIASGTIMEIASNIDLVADLLPRREGESPEPPMFGQIPPNTAVQLRKELFRLKEVIEAASA